MSASYLIFGTRTYSTSSEGAGAAATGLRWRPVGTSDSAATDMLEPLWTVGTE